MGQKEQKTGKETGKFWKKKKKTLPAAPHPQQQRFISPSLQQPAMMEGAEEGQGAILSTHKRGQQPWKPLIPYLESNKKISMILNSNLAPTAIVQSLGRNGGASTCRFPQYWKLRRFATD